MTTQAEAIAAATQLEAMARQAKRDAGLDPDAPIPAELPTAAAPAGDAPAFKYEPGMFKGMKPDEARTKMDALWKEHGGADG